MPRKPTVRKGPASNYSAPRETIVEFSDGVSGGLISIRRIDDGGPLVVEVYRMDSDVLVMVPQANLDLDSAKVQARP